MKKLLLAAALFTLATAQVPKLDHLLYGGAYYEEYLPYDRLDQDVQLLQAAGINVARITESTWNTREPQEGAFGFSHVDRVESGALLPQPRGRAGRGALPIRRRPGAAGRRAVRQG